MNIKYSIKNEENIIVRQAKTKTKQNYFGICKYCERKFQSSRKTALYCSNAHRVNYKKREKKSKLHKAKIEEIINKYKFSKE